MRILFYGSGQKKHIAELYQKVGHAVIVSNWAVPPSNLKHRLSLLWCDTVYIVYGRDFSANEVVRMAVRLKKRIIIHWIGTDVLQATESYISEQKTWNQDFPHLDIACAPHLVEELAQIGIRAEYVPIYPINKKFSPLPMPRSHAVLAYIPEPRETFYGKEIMLYLAKKHPEVPFYIVANGGIHDPMPLSNVHYLGMLNWEELKAVYAKSSILLRCTEHDGLPVMVLEALGLGRYVIFSHSFPYVNTPSCRVPEKVEEELTSILAFAPTLNYDGSEYVNAHFTAEKLMNTYKEIGII